jgi:hypothetical protein
MCRSALRFYTPNRCVTHLNDGYKYSQSWRAFHTHSSHHLLFSDLVRAPLEDDFSSHVGRRTSYYSQEEGRNLLQLGFPRKFDQR